MSIEVAAGPEQHQPHPPLAALTLAVFHATPWERAVQRAAERQPEDVAAVFKGITGLYWAYAGDLPAAQGLEAPTKQLLTRVACQHAGHTRVPGYYGAPPERGELLEVAQHLQTFVGMWAGVHGSDLASRRSLPPIIAALSADASARLDNIEYSQAHNPALELFAEGLSADTGGAIDASRMYRALTRHFADDEAAPPVAVLGRDLRHALDRMRARYKRIVGLSGYALNPQGQQLMWELLGPDKQSSVVSLREYLLGVDDPDQRDRLQAAVGRELAALTDSDLLAELERESGKRSLLGAAALGLSGDEDIDVVVDLWDLVDRIQAGGEGGTQALGTLYRQTYGTVYKYVYVRLRDPDLAEEYTARTFMRAITGVAGLERRDDSSVTGWLVRIARNITTDYFNSPAYKREVFTGELLATVGDHSDQAGYADDSAWRGTEASAMHHAMRAELLAAIAQVPSDLQRECIVLRFLEERSHEEIATMFGSTVVAVKQLQSRAVRKLRDILAANNSTLGMDFLGKELPLVQRDGDGD